MDSTSGVEIAYITGSIAGAGIKHSNREWANRFKVYTVI
jgi:hypothetical protein